jgi:arylsulfatase B
MEKFAQIEDIQRRIFAAILAYMDDSIGAILEKLREERLENNTLIFSSATMGVPPGNLHPATFHFGMARGEYTRAAIACPFSFSGKGSSPPTESTRIQ